MDTVNVIAFNVARVMLGIRPLGYDSTQEDFERFQSSVARAYNTKAVLTWAKKELDFVIAEDDECNITYMPLDLSKGI